MRSRRRSARATRSPPVSSRAGTASSRGQPAAGSADAELAYAITAIVAFGLRHARPRRMVVDLDLAEQIKRDVATAMKAGDRDRVGALRLVLSDMQKAAKDGDADELAVLPRERKRRRESEA